MEKIIGVYTGRFQPFHKGHFAMVCKMLNECDEVHIIIGSADKKGTIRNPFGIKTRKDFMDRQLCFAKYDKYGAKQYLKTDEYKDRYQNLVDELDRDDKFNFIIEQDRIHIHTLNDLTDESDISHEWGDYLYYNIVNFTNSMKFKYYTGDKLDIKNSWFRPEIQKNIEFRFVEREEVQDGISATKIREAIVNEDEEYLNKYLFLREYKGECDYILRGTLKPEIIKNANKKHSPIGKKVKTQLDGRIVRITGIDYNWTEKHKKGNGLTYYTFEGFYHDTAGPVICENNFSMVDEETEKSLVISKREDFHND